MGFAVEIIPAERGRVLIVPGESHKGEFLISWIIADQQRESVLLPTPPSEEFYRWGTPETVVSTESGWPQSRRARSS